MGITGLSNEFIVIIFLFLTLIVFAVCTVVVKDLLRSAIALGATSAILSIIMFFMDSPLGAVLELSVCAGLITAVFISTISLAKQRTGEEKIEYTRQRNSKFIYLPFLLLIVGFILFTIRSYINIDCAVSTAGPEPAVQEILWNTRKTDILGQVIIILAGVFGTTILFKERDRK